MCIFFFIGGVFEFWGYGQFLVKNSNNENNTKNLLVTNLGNLNATNATNSANVTPEMTRQEYAPEMRNESGVR